MWIKIIFGIIIPLISFGVGILKYSFASKDEKIMASYIILFLATLLVIPLVSLFFALLMLKSSFEKTNDSLASTNILISQNNDVFLKESTALVSDAIARGNHFSTIHFHKNKDILLDFIPKLVGEFNFKLQALGNGHIFENDPSKYQEFCSRIFDLAKKNIDIIKATSIVDTVSPDGFWEDGNTIQYLSNNKGLIESGVTIERYFFVDGSTKNSSLIPIANNLAAQVTVYIIDLDSTKLKKSLIKDCGLVGNGIVIESQVDSSKNIYKVDVFFGDVEKSNEIGTLFVLLNAKKKTVDEYYNMSKADIISTYANIPFV